MKKKLCLHGLGIKHQAQLLGAVKRVLPACSVKYKVKEKTYKDNDMYRYRVARFSPRTDRGYKVGCLFGVMLVRDKLIPLADVIVEVDVGNRAAVDEAGRIIRSLLEGRFDFVLDEPDIERRRDLLRGAYLLDKLDEYALDKPHTALYCHLPWHVYTISKTWQDVLRHPLEKNLVRQLRVRIRRLRSIFSLVRPLLPRDGAMYWSALLKRRADVLGSAREYDVLLMACAQMERCYGEDGSHGVSGLTKLLADLRRQLITDDCKGLDLKTVTAELSEMLLWIYSAPHSKDAGKQTLREFFQGRFSAWTDKLLLCSPDQDDPEQLHRIRVKLKRFRYALQSVPELPQDMKLLRSLKYLQDLLGLLHDEYVNRQLLEQLVAEHQQEGLDHEAALVVDWERTKAEAALERLPEQWENFCNLLQEWRGRNIEEA